MSQGKKKSFLQILEDFFTAIGEAICSPGRSLKAVGKFILKCYNLFLALPVLIAAIILAVRNSSQLPEQVSVVSLELSNLEAMAMSEIVSQTTVSRDVAVMGPLALTAVCLLLTCLSRRSVFPWLISILTLVLPVFLLISQSFPV